MGQSAFTNSGPSGPPGTQGPPGPVGPVDAAVPYPGGRLSLDPANARPTADVSNLSVYYVPDVGNRVPLWDGSQWVSTAIGSASVPLGTWTAGQVFDVFAYLSAGACALEKDGVVECDGPDPAFNITLASPTLEYATKTGDKTRLYLGTVRMSTATTVVDTKIERGVWNMYNRIPRPMFVLDPTAMWSCSTVMRYFNNSAANRVSFVLGLPTLITAKLECGAQGTGGGYAGVGLALDAPAVNPVQGPGTMSTWTYNNTYGTVAPVARYSDHPPIGFHYVQALEWIWSTAGNFYCKTVQGPYQTGQGGLYAEGVF